MNNGPLGLAGFNQLLSSKCNPQANIGGRRKYSYFVRAVGCTSYQAVIFSASATKAKFTKLDWTNSYLEAVGNRTLLGA